MDPSYVKSQKSHLSGLKLEPIYEKLKFEALRILGPNLKEMSRYEPNIFIFYLRPCNFPSRPEASSPLSNENHLNIRRNNEKGKTISSALPCWIAFHSASLRKNPNAPLALWPLGPVGAEGAVRARSARPSAHARAKRAPPAGSPQGPPRRRVPPHPGCEH